MTNLQAIVLLMSIAIILVGIAQKVRIAYPIALIIGGAALGLIPGLNVFPIDPQLILVITLPPILYYSAYSTPFLEFKANLSDILSLALGLVIFTTIVIGLLFKWLFPDLPWALTFAFGAIISPPDTAVTTAILSRFHINKRLSAILEGESLINDASGLLLYRLALIALLSGSFSWLNASLEFIRIAFGGIALGTITGFFFHKFSRWFFDPVLVVVYSFTIPYFTYILADILQVSGVLAVVINGLIGARMLIKEFASLTRIVGWATWDVAIILLHCFVFILIGIQISDIIARLTLPQLAWYAGYGLFLTFVTIILRFIWVYISRAAISQHHSFKETLVIAWSSMRGIVSLAAALALPFTLADGSPLPGRDIVIFLSFIIILLSLLIPGLSLPVLICWLGMDEESKDEKRLKVRNHLIKVVQEEIDRLAELREITRDEQSFLLTYFTMRHHILESSHPKLKSHYPNIETARLKIINQQRRWLIEMWEKSEIDDDLLSHLERELDLEEAHFARAVL